MNCKIFFATLPLFTFKYVYSVFFAFGQTQKWFWLLKDKWVRCTISCPVKWMMRLFNPWDKDSFDYIIISLKMLVHYDMYRLISPKYSKVKISQNDDWKKEYNHRYLLRSKITSFHRKHSRRKKQEQGERWSFLVKLLLNMETTFSFANVSISSFFFFLIDMDLTVYSN